MKKYLFILISVLSLSFNTQAQTESPYTTKVKVDLPVTAAGVGLSGLGVYFISKKDRLNEQAVRQISKNEVNAFDRFSAGNYSESAKNLSDIPFYGSFVMPLALLLDKDVYHNAPQVFLLYGETMSVTGALFAMTAGLVDRKRPLVYSQEAPIRERTSKNARNSFFAGHPAATATATFFVAKVFNDFNPDSPARPFVWGAAAAVPAAVGYLRLKAGKHFLSDVIIGYTIGTTVGILVPHLHKKGNNSGLSITPTYNRIEGRGLALNYTF
ncbi:phosphatase PAP2 family protein [Adhaeribacter aquaticus]|uniref:phosphatase PAP2 family protein n=1 Tax=Adhaeribacter aquaticus TaxID=299567 RepID=UPI000407E94E|nr:phosphatase PAP2 family protein [Adhaeribacter aquaticus]